MPANISNNTALMPFKTALLLVQKEDNAIVDRRALREVGISGLRIFTSGAQAARLLVGLLPGDSGPMPEIVLCHNELADMNAANFVSLIRLHPTLLSLPVLFVASYDSEAEKLQTLSDGFSGLLVRPYSQTELKRSLISMAQETSDLEAAMRVARENLDSGKFDKALAKYEALSTRANPEETFKLAMQSLKDRDWDTAIQAFHKTMKLSALKGESELGLATAWRGKGKQDLYKHYLQKSGVTFAKAAKWHKARLVYARLLKEEPTASSPFLAATERLIREGRYDEAAEAFAAGYDMSPQAEAQKCLAKSCLYAEDPQSALSGLSASLDKTPASHMSVGIKGKIEAYLEEHERRVQEQRKHAEKTSANAAARSSAVIPRHEAENEEEGEEEEYDSSGNIEVKPLGIPKKQDYHIELRGNDPESGFLSNIPVIGDAITVARLTWRLYNSSKK